MLKKSIKNRSQISGSDKKEYKKPLKSKFRIQMTTAENLFGKIYQQKELQPSLKIVKKEFGIYDEVVSKVLRAILECITIQDKVYKENINNLILEGI